MGDLREYQLTPTEFNPLDTALGGGLRRGEMILIGGAQGIGKTIGALQMARNIVMRDPAMHAFYVSYQHSEAHLMNRLLCLESVNPPEMTTAYGLRIRELQDLIVSSQALNPEKTITEILSENERAAPALARIRQYTERLVTLKASSAVTTLAAIRDMATKQVKTAHSNLVVFVDTLENVAIYPERASSEDDRATMIANGLKDIALTLNIPLVAITSVDDVAHKHGRLRLQHLRGSSALENACDVALILNNKFNLLARDHVAFNPYQARQYREWVVFTIEKNRAGRAMIDMEFHLEARFFCFNPVGQASQPTLSSKRRGDDDDPPLMSEGVLA